MKKYNIIFIAAIVPLLASCHFLEVEQTGKTSIKAFFSDVYALDASVNGAYRLTYTYYDSYMVLYPEVTGDLIRLASGTSTWRQQFDYISDESEETTAVGYIWKNGYEIVSNTNEIIKYGPDVADRYPTQKATVNNALAQAYFLRALAHLNLCLAYGQTYTYSDDASHLGVAIMTTVPDVKSKISRSSCNATYTQIVRDLNTALDLFSDGSSFDPSKASAASCKALLARVMLYMGNYSEAAETAQSVIDNYGLSLTPRDSYVDMFCKRTSGGEAIFRVNGYSAGTNLRSTFDYREPKMYPSAKLLGIFSEDSATWPGTDIRQSLLNYNYGGVDYSGVCMKFIDTEDITESEKHYDPFVLRLSEMYLIHAEASCKLGNLDVAAKDIATLEARARGVAVSDISLSYSDAPTLDQLIERERIKELFLEGHRMYDIARRHETLTRDSGCGSTLLELSYPDDRFILPIPLVELDANKNMQSNPINSTKQ